MTHRHPLHSIMPSIYLQQGLNQAYLSTTKLSKSSRNTRVTWTWIVALAALVAALVTIAVCWKNISKDTNSNLSQQVITYVNIHPKNLLHPKQVFISVKTTGKNHDGRLQPVISTWYQLARDHTYFFTDRHDHTIESQVDSGHLVVTQCGSTHSRQDLCCKMAAEFDAFLESRKK